jgi:hypothetical protein
VAYRVVCISFADGATGEDIAPAVASRLGFRLIDEQIVARAAEEAGVARQAVAGVEQRRSLVGRILEELPASGAAGASALVAFAPVGYESPGPGGDDLRGLIRSAIEEIATRGEAVIVAHAASFALASQPDALRVFITASPETRRQRIMEAKGVSAKEAEGLVSRGDANRADYLKRFYRVRSEQPTHYDLVLNTDRLTPDRAADLIVGSVRS